jgi:hypothetical protein
MFWAAKRAERAERKKDKARIAALRESIDEVWNAEFASAHTDEERQAANSIVHSITDYDQNELDWLRQKQITRLAGKYGIEVPQEHYEALGSPFKPTLTDSGVAWLNRAISRYRKDTAKDWVSIISPILSAVIAILGLLVALKKR